MDSRLPLLEKFKIVELTKYDVEPNDKDDLISELNLVYCQTMKQHKEQGIDIVEPYLFKSLHNRVKQHIRESKKNNRINDNKVIALPEGADNWIYDMRQGDKITYRHNGKLEIMIEQDREVDDKCMKCLNDIQRKIIDLYYNMNMTNDEIGKIYNISVSTVKRIKREALLIMRDCMNG